jgi:hypothetical protein
MLLTAPPGGYFLPRDMKDAIRFSLLLMWGLGASQLDN